MTDSIETTPNPPPAEPLCSAVGCHEPRAHVDRDEDGDPQSLCDAHHERVRAGRGPKTDPTRTPLELLLVPTRDGGWRARVKGRQPDGSERIVEREGFCDEQPFDTAPMIARLAVGRWIDETAAEAAGQPLTPEVRALGSVRWHDEPGACGCAEAAYREGTVGELTAYLRGAEACAEMHEHVDGGREMDVSGTRRARGFDVLAWTVLRLAPAIGPDDWTGPGRLVAARVLLRALGRLDGELGERWRRAGEVLVGLPDGWTREIAQGAARGWLEIGPNHEGVDPFGIALIDLLCAAYPAEDGIENWTDAEAIGWLTAWVIGGSASQLGAGGLLELYRLICDEAGVEVVDPAVLRAPPLPLEERPAGFEIPF